MLIGHQKEWRFLKKSAETSRISHAYLFYGPEKLGKKTLALEFVKLLECERRVPGGPCQECSSCLQIEKRIHPDLIFVEPKGKEIRISQIRELAWKLSLRPYSVPFKAAIIDKAHSMNQEAQTCLLKTLEEPRGNPLLILITEYPQALFPTILSRVQKIRFHPVQKSEIIDYLEERGVSEERANEIAEFSLGRPGEAIELFSDPGKIETRKRAITDVIKISNSDLALRFQYVKNLSEETQDLKEILETWTFYLRNNLISRLNGKKSYSSPAEKNSLTGPAQVSNGVDPFGNYSINKLKNFINRIQSTNFLISTTNVNPRLALEVLMMKV